MSDLLGNALKLLQASGEPPAKRLAIREEAPEHEKYDFHTSLICYGCGGQQIAGNEKVGSPSVCIAKGD